MSIQTQITELLFEVFREKGVAAPAIGPDTVLDQIGLEALDFAQVVIRMEEITGIDPFANGTDCEIRTLADFSGLYDSP